MVSRERSRIYSSESNGLSESYYIRRSLNFKATGIKTPSSKDLYISTLYSSIFCIYILLITTFIKFMKGILKNEFMHTMIAFSLFAAVYVGLPALYSFGIVSFFSFDGYTVTLYRLYCYGSLYNYILIPLIIICREYFAMNDFTAKIPHIIVFVAYLTSSILWYINIDKILIYKGKGARFLFLALCLMLSILYTGLSFISI